MRTKGACAAAAGITAAFLVAGPAALLIPGPAAAAPIPAGPPASFMTCAAASPWPAAGWYLGTENGMYRRTATDSCWTRCVPGGPISPIASIVPFPDRPGWLLVSIDGGDLHRSTDGGLGWFEVGDGLGGQAVERLAVDPGHPDRVLAATGTGVFRSSNRGDSWAPAGLEGGNVTIVICDPVHDGRAWAAVYGEGVYRTTDGAASWHLSTAGMDGVSSRFFEDIEVSAGGDTLFTTGQLVYRSTDGGAWWTEVTPQPDHWYVTVCYPRGHARCVVIAADNTAFRSRDGGQSWEELSPPFVDTEWQWVARRRAFADGRGGILIGAQDGEILHGGDDGDWWIAYTDDLSGGEADAFAASDDAWWLVGGSHGCWLTRDGGRSWEKSRLLTDLQFFVEDVAFAPGGGSTAWVVGGDTFFQPLACRSTDGGRTFRPVPTGVYNDGSLADVEIDPGDPDRVYITDADAGQAIFLRTSDGGAHWEQSRPGPLEIGPLLLDPSDPKVLLAGTSDGVYRSTDRGASWSPSGLPGLMVIDLSTDAVDPARLYAATSSAVFASGDAGFNWSPLGAFPPSSIRCIDATSAAVGVLAATDSGLWHLDGLIWRQLPPEDQPLSTRLKTLGMLPGGRFVAGTLAAGVALYEAAPSSVEPVFKPAFERAFESAGPGLVHVCGSPSAGPFRLSWAGTAPTGIEIFDRSGRLVRRWAGDGGSVSRNGWSWDGRDNGGVAVASGVYFYRMNGGAWASAGKLVLTR